ncbi:YciI family protein [Rhodococcus sp. CH91]|uniref:YciI family protein n=1 Tax=Rhodococcus sp. CH91 TaxID=2910256 RepID=UPI001F4B5436|nr:YciI family protein [Rhodococcus sp. CH91]
MAQYLLGIYQPDGDPPPPEILDPIMKKVGEWQSAVREAGVWVFSGGLHSPESATVVRTEGDAVTTTDGPYIEGKEHLGGFDVIDVADLDEALTWARGLAEAVTLPIEVRPLVWGSRAG